MSGSVTCRQFVEFLDDYLSGVLDLGQREAFNEHLALCPSCVSYMKTYRETVRLGKAALDATDEPVPAHVPEDLVRAILDAREKKS